MWPKQVLLELETKWKPTLWWLNSKNLSSIHQKKTCVKFSSVLLSSNILYLVLQPEISLWSHTAGFTRSLISFSWVLGLSFFLLFPTFLLFYGWLAADVMIKRTWRQAVIVNASAQSLYYLYCLVHFSQIGLSHSSDTPPHPPTHLPTPSPPGFLLAKQAHGHDRPGGRTG